MGSMVGLKLLVAAKMPKQPAACQLWHAGCVLDTGQRGYISY